MSIPARQPSLTPSLRSETAQPLAAASPAGPSAPVPSRRPSALSAGASEARRARRDQLRDYYGLKKEGQGEGTHTASGSGMREGKTKDELDLESPNFNANVYYDNLISKSSLQDLLKVAAQLKTDINALESSRHTLVYNHHPQLFAAGDTISALNARTPQLLGIVTQLQERFSEMSRMADRASLDDVPGGGAREVQGAREDGASEEMAVRKVRERLALMVAAGGAKAFAASKSASLQAAVERGVPGAKDAADECATLVAAIAPT